MYLRNIAYSVRKTVFSVKKNQNNENKLPQSKQFVQIEAN